MADPEAKVGRKHGSARSRFSHEGRGEFHPVALAGWLQHIVPWKWGRNQKSFQLKEQAMIYC